MSSATTCRALIYGALGKPRDVLKLEPNFPVPPLGPQDLSVKMLLSPVNPADINQMQGVYGMKASLPAVGGSEGVGVVTEVGGEVDNIVEGDWVVPASPGLGTWRSLLVSEARNFVKISKNMPLHLAATLCINPTTAYRMIKDFVPLEKGDCIVQNGANSGVGMSVIQLAAAWGLVTVNIVRNRSNRHKLYSYLEELGATKVMVESDHTLFKNEQPNFFEKHGRPKLGLNCVGGPSAARLMSLMAPGATLVTYGGMSLKPLTVGTGLLIFKNLRFVGHWNSKWMERNLQSEEHLEMMAELCQLAEKGLLRAPPCNENGLGEEDIGKAMDNALMPFIGLKQLFKFNDLNSL